MGVTAAGYYSLILNRTRGANLWLPKYYTHFFGTVVGDLTGGNAVITMQHPNLAEELWFILDRIALNSLTAATFQFVYIPGNAPIESGPSIDVYIATNQLPAGQTAWGAPDFLPMSFGRLTAPGNILSASLGTNANAVIGSFSVFGRLFDHEPMGAL